MKVLVTGGAGFIGSHLVEKLLAAGHETVVIDNFSTGRRENLSNVIGHDSLNVIEVDIANSVNIEPFFEGVEWVFHMAAVADIVPSIEAPTVYHCANVNGTISVLEASKKAGAKRFIYASSSSCYGIPHEFPTPETASVCPQYPYALTKYVGEQYVMHWCQVYGLPSVALRFFNVFGPRSRTGGSYGAVFGVFLAQKLAGKPFTVVGDGTQTRDFTFVTDIVDAIIAAVHSDLSCIVMNVGSDHTYSVNYLTSLLGGDVVYIPKRPGEPDCTFGDITRIRTMLGWSPKVSFEDGVKLMVENIDHWCDAPVWTPSSIEQATADWFHFLGRS